MDPGQCPVEAGELSAPRRAQRLGPTQRLPVSLQRPCDPAFHYAMSHPHTRLFLRQVPCARRPGHSRKDAGAAPSVISPKDVKAK